MDQQLAEDLAKDYANYAKIDINSQVDTTRSAIDDIMTRLEEFESIIKMAQTEGEECHSIRNSDMMNLRLEVTDLGKRINALQTLVFTMNANLNELEESLESAEANYRSTNKFFGYLNPLSMITKKFPVSMGETVLGKLKNIYSSDNYFDEQQ